MKTLSPQTKPAEGTQSAPYRYSDETRNLEATVVIVAIIVPIAFVLYAVACVLR
jgi:hypothetical protein